MTSRVEELLTELEAALDGVSTPFTAADTADRVYEGYVFSQVIAAAAEAGAIVTYEDRDEHEIKDLVFRGAPGVVHSRGRRFTHAVLRFGTARPVQEHLRVKARGRSLESESDILILDTKAARDSRRKGELPTASGCVLTIECKYFATGLLRDEALHYMGVRSGFPPSMPSLFVANTFSPKANQCLSALKSPYEFEVMPDTRFQGHMRSHIREALKRFVIKFDYGYRI